MATATPKAAPTPSNVKYEMNGDVLVIGIDTSKRVGPSKTGKTTLVGTTHGIIKLPNGVSFSVNAFAGK